VELFTPAGYGPGIAYANFSLGVVHQRTGRSIDALTYFKAAVEQKERCVAPPPDVYAECEVVGLRQPSYYDPLIELLFQTGRGDEAFRYAEQKTEHALYEELGALVLKTRAEPVNALLTRLHHARALHIGAERQLAKTLMRGPDDRQIREDIVATLKKADNAVRDAASAIVKANRLLEPAVLFGGASIADVQRQLPDGTALLRCVPTSRSLYSFAITNSRSTLQVAAISREHLLDMVTGYRSTFRQLSTVADSPAVQRRPLEQQMQELSMQLYAAIVRPVESVLSGATHVIVLPDEEITSIPVHALRRGGPETSYCIEQFAVSYIPSLIGLKFQKSITIPVHDIVTMGHPGTTTWDVEYELRDIRAFYKDARLFFGQQASLATLQRERGDVLHLAVDLHFSGRAPGNANVVLSDGKTRSGTREALWEEIPTTTAFPTVVVSHLRADSIGIDRLLPALFLANGSSSVIVNMHPASRKAKKYFGEIFYTALLAGKSPESAYREALLEMIKNKEYATPHDWAPFSLWGK
jgi:CHAT domain-containing protein